MKTKKLFLFLISIGVLTVVLASRSNVKAFDDKAHEALSEQASKVSGLDNFLKTALRFGFPDGANEVIINGRRVNQLIQDGAFDEDRPSLWRPRHHFHNPRLAWDQAGWRPPPFSIQLGESSILWSQETGQVIGGKHSWKDARDSYFRALTASSDSERKSLYAETFRALGHLIHLVQDAAVPSHTRNDTHLSYKGIGDSDGFHSWSEFEQATGMIAAANPPSFDISSLNQPSPDAQAPVPISRLIDSTAGDIGLLGLSPGLNIGIAEYSSANFFSDDTVNSPNFLSPRSSQVEVRVEPDATGNTKRPYIYFRPGFGEQNYPLALASAMSAYVIDPLATPTDNGLDSKVFQGYGAKLFPRAIGYSAGLIDYFFRGKIDATSWSPGFLLVPWGTQPNSIVVENVQVKVDGSNEQGGVGTMRLVFVYLFQQGGAPNPGPEVVVSQPVSVSASSSPQTLVFNFNSLPFPPTSPSQSGSHIYRYGGILVYKGALGQESEAVVGAGYCIDTDGSKYDRQYQFEHSAPGVWFPQGAAYIDYIGC